MKNKKKSITLMIVAIITLLTLIIGATYAYFQASGNSGSDTDVNVVTVTGDLLTFKIDNAINISVTQSDFKKGAGNKSGSTKASAILTASNSKNIESTSDRYNIYFIIEANDFIYTTDNATAEILLNVTDPNGNKVENITGLVHTDKGFDITTRTGGFLLVPDYDITATRGNTTTQEWKVEVTLVNLDTDQNKNTGKTLSGKLYVTKEKMSSYELTKITNVETETTYNSIKTTLKVASGTSPIEKYYYGIEKISSDATGYANTNSLKRLAFNDVSLIESDKPTYTFKNLEDNATYKIYSYGIDKNKIKTNMYETEITTNTYNIAKINNVTHTSTLNSITLNVNAQKGDNEIEKYFYSKDNGETYVESTSSTYTFNNLTDTTEYKIKVKVLDSYGRYSTEYAEAIATVTYILPSVTKVTPTTKYNQITVVTTGTKGTNEIIKYYYSINNSSYVEGTSTYTFTNLSEQTTYNIKVKVEDTNGRMSNEYSLSATTDAYKLPTITELTTSSTSSSITINVSGQNGDGTITEYYYSKDNGSNYVKSKSSSYTFTNLTSNTTFYIKVYVKDSNGKSSSVFTTSNSTILTIADYVISQYTGTQGSNGIYYHNSTLANGAGDNSYRYAGANPNNYVCFGSDATTCPEDNLYRIIGVFDGKVKLIKASAASSSLLGTDGACAYNSGYPNLYYWSTLLSCPSSTSSYISDNSNNVMFVSNRKNILAAGDAGVVNYCNLWNYSDLNKINLNTNYLNNIGTKWSKMIENSVWRISGYNASSVIPSVMHNAEITNATKTYGPSDGTSKIGLIYVSDFGFAANPSAWTTTMDNYKNYNDVNWLSSIDTWTITPNSSEEETVFSLSNGNIYFTGNVAGTGQKDNAIPAIYLLASVAYVSGSGASSDPIRIN